VRTATAFVPRDPDRCWRAFIDVASLTAWVPGIRRAEIIAKEKGLPSEVHYEFASSLAYTLSYRYDPAARVLSWEPKLGKRDAVTGFARFDPADGGTQITYAIEDGDGRSTTDRALGDPDALVAAFAAFMTRVR
jgi:hypothetical protein